MQINATFDSSVDSAPAAYKAAIATAIAKIDSLFSSSATLNISFGWGEQDGQAVTGVASNTTNGSYVDYDTLKSALASHATDIAGLTAANTLKDADPSGGGSYFVSSAQSKALGIGTASSVDGYIGLSSSVTWSTAADGSVAAGEHDMVAAIMNQITAVMGRESLTGGTANNAYTALDLMRYDASNTTGTVVKTMAHDLSPGAATFSLNGQTSLATFADSSTGAPGADFGGSTQADAFAESYAGVKQTFTNTDLELMSAIGWAPSSTAYSAVTADENSGGAANAGVALQPASDASDYGTSAIVAANPASLAAARSAAPAEVSPDAQFVGIDSITVAEGQVTISGSVTAPSGETTADAVQLLDNGQAVAIGATDGSDYSLTSTVSAGTHTFVVQAVQATQSGSDFGDVTGVLGSSTAQQETYSVTTGIQGMPYTSEVDEYDTSGHLIEQTRAKADGTVWLQSDGSQLANGDTVVTSTGGALFDQVHFTQVETTYGSDGSVLERAYTGGDGTPDSDTSASRSINYGMHDVYTFAPNPGDLTVQNFLASGDDHSVVNLSSTGFGSIADVLRATTMSDAGAVIHISPTDSVTLVGVTKLDLIQNKGDIALHA